MLKLKYIFLYYNNIILMVIDDVDTESIDRLEENLKKLKKKLFY